jgi:hypothetical protein
VRLLLDAHFSGNWVGNPLRNDGHDVRAADADDDLAGLSDKAVIAVAEDENRVLITGDTEDFSKILSSLGHAGAAHSGVILVPSAIRNNDYYGTLLRGIRAAIQDSTQVEWVNRVV